MTLKPLQSELNTQQYIVPERVLWLLTLETLLAREMILLIA